MFNYPECSSGSMTFTISSFNLNDLLYSEAYLENESLGVIRGCCNVPGISCLGEDKLLTSALTLS